MSTVIKVENLSKEYRLGTIGHNYLFRDVQSAWARLRGKEDPNQKMGAGQVAKGKYRALDDVSFEVKQGEVLGIIGRNGAGKSTLLKILSRVTTPTQGSIKVRGRIASLLEVGTGFHPELTGRENIFLNGAILGMSKNEVKAKFDEIVDFAGIGEFIDTPVKRYSSGMYVRLAFAVAAHLEPEILIIDEVLAVGDAEFQKKCLGKMKDVAGQGRTVLFVSHQLSMMAGLCRNGLLLNKGIIQFYGHIAETIKLYYSLQNGNSDIEFSYTNENERPGNRDARLISGRVVNAQSVARFDYTLESEIIIEMTYELLTQSDMLFVPNFHVKTQSGSYVFVVNAPNIQKMELGKYKATCKIPAHLLNDETYTVDLALTAYNTRGNIEVCFNEMEALMFSVSEDLHNLSPERYNYAGKIPGMFRPKLDWQIRQI